jgi:hypothetical protein
VSEVNGDQFLRVWEIATRARGDLTPLSHTSSASRCPRASCSRRDGNYLYGSSYYTGVSNIFRYEVATAKSKRSRTRSRLLPPVPLADGRLLVLTYTSDGFVPPRSIRARSRM